jgi:hypothetical protein
MITVPATGPVQLRDIRFPGSTPVATRITPAQLRSITAGTLAETAPRARTRSSKPGLQITNWATNSGIIRGNQFGDGGLRGIGLQWRNVKVSSSVFVVRNTLSVNIVENPTGPINISNVTFNSGALDRAKPKDQRIIWPPNYLSRIHVHPLVGKPLPHNPNVINRSTNGGILLGGQFQVGGVVPAHINLQWRKAAIHGSVTIIENVLSVTPPPAGTGPINVQHVLFA